MTNDQLIRNFRDRKINRNNGHIRWDSYGNFTCTPNTVYSYAEPILHRFPKKVNGKPEYIKTGDRWSVTTSRHIGYVQEFNGPTVSFLALKAAGIDPSKLTAESIIDYVPDYTSHDIVRNLDTGEYKEREGWTVYPSGTWKPFVPPKTGMLISYCGVPEIYAKEAFPGTDIKRLVHGYWHTLGACVISERVKISEDVYDYEPVPQQIADKIREEEKAYVPTVYPARFPEWMRTETRFWNESAHNWHTAHTDYGKVYRDTAGNLLTWNRVFEAKYQIRHFLCSMDEGIYFVSMLPRKVKTVREAFETLKPEPVKVAEKAGIPVKRQGEWFFVPSGMTDKEMAEKIGTSQKALRDRSKVKPLPQREQTRNAHTCRQVDVDGAIYARGSVYHRAWNGELSGEHRTCKLGTEWHTCHRNTERASWTVDGKFD